MGPQKSPNFVRKNNLKILEYHQKMDDFIKKICFSSEKLRFLTKYFLILEFHQKFLVSSRNKIRLSTRISSIYLQLCCTILVTSDKLVYTENLDCRQKNHIIQQKILELRQVIFDFIIETSNYIKENYTFNRKFRVQFNDN